MNPNTVMPENKHKRLMYMRLLRAIFLLLSMCTTQIAAALESPTSQGLDSIQAEHVREIGSAILIAKRSVKPDPAVESLRQQVAEIHAALVQLTATDGDTSVQLSSAIAATAPAVSAKDTDWKKTNKAHIDNISHSIAKLQLQTKNFPRQKLLAASAKSPNQGFSSTTTPTAALSEPFLDRVSHLQADVDTALELPPEARQARLLAITKEMEVTAQPRQEVDVGNKETPTISTQTQHRALPSH